MGVHRGGGGAWPQQVTTLSVQAAVTQRVDRMNEKPSHTAVLYCWVLSYCMLGRPVRYCYKKVHARQIALQLLPHQAAVTIIVAFRP